MNSEYSVYKDLLNQYSNLSTEEQQSILIYKSDFYYIINEMSKIDNFFNINEELLLEYLNKNTILNYYETLKKRLMRPENITVRYTLFHNIDMTTIYSCLKSLKEVYKIITLASNQLVLSDSITLYRAISTSELTHDISKGNIISTSIDPEDISAFLYHNDENHIYVIDVEKGTNVLCAPYSIMSKFTIKTDLTIERKEQMKILKEDENAIKEVILFKDNIDYMEIDCKEKYDSEFNKKIYIHYIKAYKKENRNEMIK